MFFVDDDQSNVFEGRKERGARADCNAGPARPNFEPGLSSFLRSLGAVKGRKLTRKPRLKAFSELGCECDFWNKHKAGLIALERLFHTPKIDFRFS